ncbi:hypothetical protein EDB85DRAFT_1888297 [Lactarius pseudohatsudake]|nr:hypothetical protein EDB85DRAFT_1888297 [Lactarius pseudohatsudake]
MPPRRGEADNLQQAPSLVPSCSPSSLQWSVHIPKKEGAKKVMFFLSLQNRHPQTAFKLSELYSYCTMLRKRGAGVVNAGTWRLHWSCCSTQLGLVCPFLHEWGVMGWGGKGRCWGNGRGSSMPLHTPLPREWGRGGGEVLGAVCLCAPLLCEWGRVELGVACPHVPHADRVVWPRGKGGAGGGMPVCTPLPREWGLKSGGPGVAPLCAPFLRKQGGAKREGEEGRGRGRGDTERQSGVPLCAPFRMNGREGGWPASCAPFHVYGVVWTRGKEWGQSQCGEMGQWALCAPYLHAKGAAAVNAGERGHRAFPFRREWGVEGCPLLYRKLLYGNGGGKGGRVILDSVAEAACACHVSALVIGFARTIGGLISSPLFHPPLPPPPPAIPAPFMSKRGRKRIGQHPTPSPSLHAGKGVHKGNLKGAAHKGMLLPLPFPSVCATRFVGKGGT